MFALGEARIIAQVLAMPRCVFVEPVSKYCQPIIIVSMKLPDRYTKLIAPLIEKAKGFLEAGETLSPIAFVGSFDSGQVIPILINTSTEEAKDQSAQAIRLSVETIDADYVFSILEGWGLPKDKLHRYEEIIERYGSIGASPWKIDTANFLLETRHGIWGAQIPLKFKVPSKKRRMFAVPVVLQFMDGAEGRFMGLLPLKGPIGTLH